MEPSPPVFDLVAIYVSHLSLAPNGNRHLETKAVKVSLDPFTFHPTAHPLSPV